MWELYNLYLSIIDNSISIYDIDRQLFAELYKNFMLIKHGTNENNCKLLRILYYGEDVFDKILQNKFDEEYKKICVINNILFNYNKEEE